MTCGIDHSGSQPFLRQWCYAVLEHVILSPHQVLDRMSSPWSVSRGKEPRCCENRAGQDHDITSPCIDKFKH